MSADAPLFGLVAVVSASSRRPRGRCFRRAIIAGTMAAKRTHEVIPFCHPLGIKKRTLIVDIEGDDAVIRCSVSVHHKTGVEMEALTGASVAALTIYDMCKAPSALLDQRRLRNHDVMRQHKAAIEYHDRSQLHWTFQVLSHVCTATFVSVRPDQREEPTRAGLPQIVDSRPGIGRSPGFRRPCRAHPKAAWLVVACDLPFLNGTTLL